MPRSNIRAIVLLLPALLSTPAAFAQPAFRLENPVVSQFEDGPPLGSLRLIPGESVHFSFLAANYHRSETGRVSVTGHVSIFDPRGIRISPAEEIPFLTTLSEDDKDWKPKLHTEAALPPIAPPGKYRIKYDATDELSHESASGETTFDVEAKFVAPADTLTVRELHFFRNQEDQTPLITPVFRAGDMIWVKFYMVGYKLGEMNSIDASYDVDVLGADGKSILHQDDAAAEKSTSYYPQPYVPGIFNMTLKPAMSHAVFTVVITAHDAIGEQTASAREQFQVD